MLCGSANSRDPPRALPPPPRPSYPQSRGNPQPPHRPVVDRSPSVSANRLRGAPPRARRVDRGHHQHPSGRGPQSHRPSGTTTSARNIASKTRFRTSDRQERNLAARVVAGYGAARSGNVSDRLVRRSGNSYAALLTAKRAELLQRQTSAPTGSRPPIRRPVPSSVGPCRGGSASPDEQDQRDGGEFGNNGKYDDAAERHAE
jgi:hypothetical protein